MWIVALVVAAMVAVGASCTEPVDTSITNPDGGESGPNWCYCTCAALSTDVEPGCADVCDSTKSGATTPDFCNGGTRGTACAECMASRCGASKPPAPCKSW